MRIKADTSLRAYSIMPTMLHVPSQHNKETCDTILSSKDLEAHVLRQRHAVHMRLRQERVSTPEPSDEILLAGDQIASRRGRAV